MRERGKRFFGLSSLLVLLCAQAHGEAPTSLAWTNISSGTLSVSWDGHTDAAAYIAVLSSAPDFIATIASGTTPVNEQTTSYMLLEPNTTHYFKVKVSSDADVQYSQVLSTYTLSLPPAQMLPEALAVNITSVTMQWAAMPVAPASMSASGYSFEASTTGFDGTGLLISTQTASLYLSTLTVMSPALTANTTYHFRVGSLNVLAVLNYRSLPSVATLAFPPSPVGFTGVYPSSINVSWDLTGGSAYGFKVEASSTGFDGTGTVYASATYAGSLRSLYVTDLDADTTYYFQVASLNHGGVYSYADFASTATLANAPLAPIVTAIGLSSMTIAWTAPAGGLQGYQIIASSTDFDGLSVVYSTMTSDTGAASLAFENLAPNTSY
ncbi:MAG: fibronectin type III domain-containing protein, partial [Elusimicrobiota bacterium]